MEKANVLKTYKTRSQTQKNKDELISLYEEKIEDLDSSNKTYELLISKMQVKLNDKEKLIKVLTEEQQENSIEFEIILKENLKLKNELAKKESENIDLQNELINLSGLNHTLTEETEEIFHNNSNTIQTLKSQLNQLKNENHELQINFASKHMIESIDMKVLPPSKTQVNIVKRFSFRNKKLAKKIKKQNKNIKKILHEYQKIIKTNNSLKQSLENIKKYDVMKIKENLSNHSKYILENKTDLGKLSVNSIKTIQKIVIIGDHSTKNMATLLRSKGYDNIYSNTYTNAPLKEIIRAAGNIIDCSKNMTLAIIIRHYEDSDIENYPKYIKKLINKTKGKNIKLVFTNVPYLVNNEPMNHLIDQQNSHLNILTKFDQNLEIINTSNIKINKVQAREFKNIVTYFLEKHTQNMKTIEKGFDNEDKMKNFIVKQITTAIK